MLQVGFKVVGELDLEHLLRDDTAREKGEESANGMQGENPKYWKSKFSLVPVLWGPHLAE